MLLLTKLQSSKDIQYTNCFIKTLGYLFALDKPQFGIDQIIMIFDNIQHKFLFYNIYSLFYDILKNVIIKKFDNISIDEVDKKVIIVGYIRLLSYSKIMQDNPYTEIWYLFM